MRSIHTSIILTFFFVLNALGQNAYFDAKDLLQNESFYRANLENIMRMLETNPNIFPDEKTKKAVLAMNQFLNGDEFSTAIQSNALDYGIFKEFMKNQALTLVNAPYYRIEPTTRKGKIFTGDNEYTIYDVVTRKLELKAGIPVKFSDMNGNYVTSEDYSRFTSVYDRSTGFIYRLATGEKYARYDDVRQVVVTLATDQVIMDAGSITIEVVPDIIAAAAREAVSTNAASFTTNLIDATAQFLVDRVQAELTMAFFEKFKNRLNTSTELSTLMPNTLYLLNQQNVFHLPTMGDVWTKAFQTDIQGLVGNFNTLLATDPAYSNLKNNTELRTFLVAYEVVQMNSKGASYVDILNQLKADFVQSGNYLSNDGPDFLSNAINFASILGNNLTDIDGKNFILLSDFKSMSPKELLYFAGFVFQQNKDFFNSLPLNNNATVADVFKSNYENLLTVGVNTLELLDDFMELRKTYALHKLDPTFTDYTTDYVAFSHLIVKLFDNIFQARYFNIKDAYFKSPYFTTYRPSLHNVVQAYEATLTKNYGQVLLHGMQAIEPVVNQKIALLENRLKTSKSSKAKKELAILKGFIKNLSFYGGFMVDVLACNEAADIKSVIEKFAQPVGSYQVKRTGKLSIDFNAYPGLYGGYENNARPEWEEENFGFVTGVTAPLGLSISWGNSLGKGNSFSFFVPLVDIGAAFSYRWSNQTQGFPQDITFTQILSPGIHAVWGLKNVPVSMMFGFQYTPELRRVSNLNNQLTPNVWRIGLSAVVDIPIFNIYNRSE